MSRTTAGLPEAREEKSAPSDSQRTTSSASVAALELALEASHLIDSLDEATSASVVLALWSVWRAWVPSASRLMLVSQQVDALLYSEGAVAAKLRDTIPGIDDRANQVPGPIGGERVSLLRDMNGMTDSEADPHERSATRISSPERSAASPAKQTSQKDAVGNSAACVAASEIAGESDQHLESDASDARILDITKNDTSIGDLSLDQLGDLGDSIKSLEGSYIEGRGKALIRNGRIHFSWEPIEDPQQLSHDHLASPRPQSVASCSASNRSETPYDAGNMRMSVNSGSQQEWRGKLKDHTQVRRAAGEWLAAQNTIRSKLQRLLPIPHGSKGAHTDSIKGLLPDVALPRTTALSADAIKVTLVQGRNLPIMDHSKSDPYAKLAFGKSTKKSKVKRGDLNPTWNESFVFKIDKVAELPVLTISVYDEDLEVGKTRDEVPDDLLGKVEVVLEGNLEADKPMVGWFTLQDLGAPPTGPAGSEAQIKLQVELSDAHVRKSEKSLKLRTLRDNLHKHDPVKKDAHARSLRLRNLWKGDLRTERDGSISLDVLARVMGVPNQLSRRATSRVAAAPSPAPSGPMPVRRRRSVPVGATSGGIFFPDAVNPAKASKLSEVCKAATRTLPPPQQPLSHRELSDVFKAFEVLHGKEAGRIQIRHFLDWVYTQSKRENHVPKRPRSAMSTSKYGRKREKDPFKLEPAWERELTHVYTRCCAERSMPGLDSDGFLKAIHETGLAQDNTSGASFRGVSVHDAREQFTISVFHELAASNQEFFATASHPATDEACIQPDRRGISVDDLSTTAFKKGLGASGNGGVDIGARLSQAHANSSQQHTDGTMSHARAVAARHPSIAAGGKHALQGHHVEGGPLDTKGEAGFGSSAPAHTLPWEATADTPAPAAVADASLRTEAVNTSQEYVRGGIQAEMPLSQDRSNWHDNMELDKVLDEPDTATLHSPHVAEGTKNETASDLLEIGTLGHVAADQDSFDRAQQRQAEPVEKLMTLKQFLHAVQALVVKGGKIRSSLVRSRSPEGSRGGGAMLAKEFADQRDTRSDSDHLAACHGIERTNHLRDADHADGKMVGRRRERSRPKSAADFLVLPLACDHAGQDNASLGLAPDESDLLNTIYREEAVQMIRRAEEVASELQRRRERVKSLRAKAEAVGISSGPSSPLALTGLDESQLRETPKKVLKSAMDRVYPVGGPFRGPRTPRERGRMGSSTGLSLSDFGRSVGFMNPSGDSYLQSGGTGAPLLPAEERTRWRPFSAGAKRRDVGLAARESVGNVSKMLGRDPRAAARVAL